jgi:predicted RNA-binding Zn ribbon-like protein
MCSRCWSEMKVSTKSEKFLWLGNSAALDFVNTQTVQARVATDLLASGDDLLLWLREAGLVPAYISLRPNEATLDRAVELARQYRAEVRKGLEQLIRHHPIPESLISATNELLAANTHAFRLLGSGRGFELEDIWRFPEPSAFCAPVAHAFARLLSNGELGRIRRCKNPYCPLFFFDTSKSGTRSWCSLNLCGNRFRTEAFRKRQKRQKSG